MYLSYRLYKVFPHKVTRTHKNNNNSKNRYQHHCVREKFIIIFQFKKN